MLQDLPTFADFYPLHNTSETSMFIPPCAIYPIEPFLRFQIQWEQWDHLKKSLELQFFRLMAVPFKSTRGRGVEISVTPRQNQDFVTPQTKMCIFLTPLGQKHRIFYPPRTYFFIVTPRRFCSILPHSDSFFRQFCLPRTVFCVNFAPRTAFFTHFTPSDSLF